MLIDWRAFNGEIPRLKPDKLPQAACRQAMHVDFSEGDLRPLPAMGLVATFTDTIRSLFTMDGINFLSWSTDVDAVRGPAIEDTYHRIYFTDAHGLWFTFQDQARPSGGAPAVQYKAGVPAPTAPLVLSINSAIDGMTITAKFFYEAAGVKYQEQTVNLNVVTPAKKYWFTPPLKNAVLTTTTPGSVADEALLMTAYQTPAGALVTARDNITIGGPDIIIDSLGSPAYAVKIYDGEGREHLVSALWSLSRFGVLYDSDAGAPAVPVSPDDPTQPNPTSTPAGKTPEGAMPMLQIIAVRADDAVTVFDCYSSGSSFNLAQPAAVITLAADPSITSRMNVTIQYGTSNSSASLLESRAYTYTFINAYGEESIPAPTASIDVNVFEQVRLIVTPIAAGLYAPITKARVYRTATGTSGVTEFFYALDCDLSGGYVFLDRVKTSALGSDIIESWTWEVPPADLHGLTYIGNGMLAGISGTQVCICEPYRPHAWPKEYAKLHPSTPVRLMPNQNSVVVTTTGYPYLLTGSTPDGMVQQRLAAQQGAVSKHAHADLGEFIAYATNDGIALVAGGQVSIAQSLSLWGRKKWRELYGGRLHLMRFAANDGQLVCFFEAGGDRQFMVRFDEATGMLTEHTFPMTAAFVLPDTDALYVGSGRELYAFDGGEVGTASWWSREIVLPKPRNIGCLQVLCEGACTATVYADGVAVLNAWPFTDSVIKRLPTDVIARRWSVKLNVTGIVKEAYLAGTVLDLQQV